MIDINSVLIAEQDLLQAMKSSDVNNLDRLLHDRLIFLLPNGATVDKKTDLDAHGSKAMILEKADFEQGPISIIGDCAISNVKLNASGTMLGQPLSGEFHYIRVWKDFGGQLKVIGGGCVSN
ncbi:nuclear transport factor 2 family protein [Flavobacterium selenitireducens]|uniref:nuclear transport factor 2 family protein n=1 Tax=Flavobacterium selenitireducens TaxID=2722704 RepID=UPI00168C03FF|nr:nuclear transport factor 2 family protein [Flavobacterium selenitireducens]MBD3580993.1 nuclear transport factor 2 family protein [Flavobacterium selenitireducens]